MSKRNWRTPLCWAIVGAALCEALNLLIFGGADPRWMPVLLATSLSFALQEIVHTDKRKLHLQLLTLVISIIGMGAMTKWPQIGRIIDHSPNLEIYYHGQKLDGQSVTLAKSCIPASSVQPDMCIDQNYPNNFDLFGMAMSADGSVEEHDVLVDFSTKVTVPSPSWSCWKPANTEGTEYNCFLNKQVVPAQLQVEIEPFYGTPLPSPEMHVTVRVFYGSKMTRATFALRTPN